MPPILNVISGLDLEIQGALGSFSVTPAAPDSPSIPVKYIQTHISFDLDGGHKERLFANLLPVREIFQTKDMGFDDLMQRDIDDGRVSNELIPYLLEAGQAVKFFPPIVAVVVPVGPQKQLQTFYPALTEDVIQDNGFSRCIQRSGPKGKESFEFEQIEVNGDMLEFDNARLRINTNRCKIVIVDGQHRAMALLALYRNIKGWPDNTAAFTHYYTRWSSKHLGQFDLKNVSLPIAVCVFPTLSGEAANYRVTKACRAVFLALNKNARPVTKARNILLNDKDLIAIFERSILEEVKAYEIDSPTRLRLWNFELDAEKDRSVLTSPVAFSGVMHLHALLERALMLNQKPEGFAIRGTSNYWSKNYIDDTVLHRLDGPNLLGAEVAASTFRTTFTKQASDTLLDSFTKRYVPYILKGFKEFHPYAAMAIAASDIEVELRNQTDKRTHAMMFEGQGVLRVFLQYLKDLSDVAVDQHKLNRTKQASELDAIIGELKNLQANITKYETEFRHRRTQELLASTASAKLPYLYAHIDTLYKGDLTTAAFQIALFATFFFMMEDLHGQDNGELRLSGDKAEMIMFDEYIACINSFFAPKADSDVKRVLSTFVGSVSGVFGSQTMVISQSETTLRSIVIPTELKPDEWYRFRYIFLELWRPQEATLADLVRKYREQSRKDVLSTFFRQKIKIHCRAKGIEETNVTDKDRAKMSKEAAQQYESALTDLVGKLPDNEHQSIMSALEKPTPPTEEEVAPPPTEEEV